MENEQWLTCRAIERRLKMNYRGIRTLVERGLLGVRSIPGSRRLYSARDAEMLESIYTQVATFEGITTAAPTNDEPLGRTDERVIAASSGEAPGAPVVNGSPLPMPHRRRGRPRKAPMVATRAAESASA